MDSIFKHFRSVKKCFHFTAMATPAPGRCALNVVDPVLMTEDNQRGYYFGASPNSRLEYESLPASFRIK
jgi:hypothetical protein